LKTNCSTSTAGRELIERVRLTCGERRLELGVSASELARASRVQRATIRKLERGEGRVHPAIVLAVSSVLTELELHVPPPPVDEPAVRVAPTPETTSDDVLADLLPFFDIERRHAS
jgi:transcriptional regulator with XRE-family HTH domain